MIIFGAFIFAVGLNSFTIANNLAEGGFTGIALLIYYLYEFPTGWVILFLNIPLFIIAWLYLGKNSLIYTILGTISVSVLIEITANFRIPTDDLLLAALYSGVTTGIGLGVILRNGGTTAGVDIIARLINKYFGISLGKIIFAFDIIVILVSAIFLGSKIAMYSLVGLFLTSRVIDLVQEGVNTAKAIMIISNESKVITDIITTELQRGTTLLEGHGGYTDYKKDVILCVVNRSEISRIKSIVKTIDKNAFVIVSDVHEVLGEGFSHY
jgi:uncharacterized membrane-anchored protein YitT (DUF2179 family)